jgi:hypothetical protein
MPSSPTRSRRSGSVPVFPLAYKTGKRIDLVHHKTEPLYGVEEIERARSTQLSRNASSSTPESVGERDADDDDQFKQLAFDGHPLRWFTSSNLCNSISLLLLSVLM